MSFFRPRVLVWPVLCAPVEVLRDLHQGFGSGRSAGADCADCDCDRGRKFVCMMGHALVPTEV